MINITKGGATLIGGLLRLLPLFAHTCIAVCGAPAAKLEVGDAAPRLTIYKWLKGNPVNEFKRGQVYVVEFGATWCAPCRKALPHLSELAQRYAERVTFISVFARERINRDDPTDTSYIAKVSYLVEEMGSRMQLNVAVDGPTQTTANAWGIDAVPRAFAVDGTGKISWIGSPFELESALDGIINGRLSLNDVLVSQQAFDSSVAAIFNNMSAGEWSRALSSIEQLIESNPRNLFLPQLKFRVLIRCNKESAHAYLEQLLAANPNGFDWDHLFAEAFAALPDFDVQLTIAAATRAIEKAETGMVAAHLLEYRAKLYRARSGRRSTMKQAKEDLFDAVQDLEKAVHLIRITGFVDDLEHFASACEQMRFMLFAGTEDAKANDQLRAILAANRKNTNWLDLVDDGLTVQRRPDYDLLLNATDRALAQVGSGPDRALPLSRKADVYAAAGDVEKALSHYQQALNAAKEGERSELLEELENRLTALKKKHG